MLICMVGIVKVTEKFRLVMKFVLAQSGILSAIFAICALVIVNQSGSVKDELNTKLTPEAAQEQTEVVREIDVSLKKINQVPQESVSHAGEASQESENFNPFYIGALEFIWPFFSGYLLK